VNELTAAFDRVMTLGSDPGYDFALISMPGARPLELVRRFGDLTVLGIPAYDEAFPDAIWAPDKYPRLGLPPADQGHLVYGQRPSPILFPAIWPREPV
jgi:hypothetical protein